MKYDEVMKLLKELGTEQNRKIYKRHGNDIDMFGVSVANLKNIVKPIKKDYELGRKLLFSNNSDAMYMAKWMVDPYQLTIDDLESLLDRSEYYVIIDNVVASLTARNKNISWHAIYKWIDHENHRYRQAAYSVLSYILSNYDNSDIDISFVRDRLLHAKDVIHKEANRVRYSMNSFIISAGGYLKELTDLSIDVANEIGEVKVFMGETSCKVPFAPEYIKNMISRGSTSKKRKID